MGSNMLGNRFSGLMFAEGEMPMLPSMADPRSVRMSPKRLLATITSKAFGFMIMSPASASTCMLRDSIPGYPARISSKIRSQKTME
ncbi:MAG: hypothetical protein BWX71_01380 [Deltaproteobacteria bacterium ADurb.Bin072]|nr:MAG: hypothetical protein BWX71_01380 [Deltaproteobacteria bacterium ADurb.Bin072]